MVRAGLRMAPMANNAGHRHSYPTVQCNAKNARYRYSLSVVWQSVSAFIRLYDTRSD